MPFLSHESVMSVKTSTFESWRKTKKYLPVDCFNTILTCWDLQDVGSKIIGNNVFIITGSKNLKIISRCWTSTKQTFIIGSREKILKALTKKA